MFLPILKGHEVRFSKILFLDPILTEKRGQWGQNGVKPHFWSDFDQIGTRSMFWPILKGPGVRFFKIPFFDPIEANLIKKGTQWLFILFSEGIP